MKLLLFIGNFLVSILFGLDIMSYYLLGGLHIISNDVNRPFIMWLGFLVSFLSLAYFIHNHFTVAKRHASTNGLKLPE